VTFREATARSRWLLKKSAENLKKHEKAKELLAITLKRPNSVPEDYLEYLRKNVRDLEKQIYIVHEWSSQTTTKPPMVRGWKRTVHHSEIFIRTGKAISPEDLRAIYGDITAKPREAFLLEIAKRYKEHHKTDCSPGEPERILAMGKSGGKSKIFWYDKDSDTWRGAKWRDVTPTPRWISLTKAQEIYFRLFDELPPIAYNVEDPRKCKLISDGSTFDLVSYVQSKAVERNIETNSGEPLTPERIVKLYIDSWKCVQRNGKRFGPMWKEKRRGLTYNSVTGRHYYHLNMLRSMPRLGEGSEQFLEWMNARVRQYVADDFGADPEKLLAKAIECGDAVSNEDPIEPAIAGAEIIEAKRKEKENNDKYSHIRNFDPKQDVPILPILEKIYDRESKLHNKLRNMKEFAGDVFALVRIMLKQQGMLELVLHEIRIAYHILSSAKLVIFDTETCKLYGEAVYYADLDKDEE
jgi:hypothetical protein